MSKKAPVPFYSINDILLNSDKIKKNQQYPYSVLTCGATHEGVINHKGTNDYMFTYIHKGSVSLINNKGDLIEEIYAPAAIIIHPFEPQILNFLPSNSDSDENERYWFHFQGTEIVNLLKSLKIYDKRVFFFKNENQEIIDLINKIYFEFLSQKEQCDCFCMAYLIQILSTTARTYIENKFVTKNSKLEPAIQYMHRHFAAPITDNILAELCSMSIRNFIRIFKNTYHTTPHKYLINLRISHAQSLLSTTEKSINQIAFEVGYESSTHFINSFKQIVGISPNQLRNRSVHNQNN